MKPRIVSWNVRGLNEKDKRPRIRVLPIYWKAGIVCFLDEIGVYF
jgi:hypothetical protein